MVKPDEVQSRIIADINEAGDCFSQYTYLLARAASLPDMSEEERACATLVDGCQSKVWIQGACKGGLMEYRATSDTLIIKGVLALLLDIYSHQTPEDVVSTPVRFLRETDLADLLESTRLSGIAAMERHIHACAQGFLGAGADGPEGHACE